jgi:hypothetical protein
MPLTIIIAAPQNGAQNVPVFNGVIMANGTVNQNGTTVSAQLSDGTDGNPANEVVNANQQWSFRCGAARNTTYTLTVSGTCNGGNGQSSVTFTTAS